jgi:hypothetical protein
MVPSTPLPATDRSDDPLVGLVTGLYAALLAVPPAVLAVERLLTGDAGVLYGTVLVTLTVVTGVGWWATGRWGGRIVGIGGSRRRWLPAVFGGVVAAGWFAGLRLTGVVGAIGFFFGLFAMGVGFALAVMLRTRHTDAVVGTTEIEREFSAGWPHHAQRRARRISLAAAAVTGVAFLTGLLADVEWLRLTGQVLFPAVIATVSWGDERTYTVSAAGLEQRNPVARQLFRWDDFDGYTRTDDALVLHRRWRVDTRFALADLDDPDAVEGAIETHLEPA